MKPLRRRPDGQNDHCQKIGFQVATMGVEKTEGV